MKTKPLLTVALALVALGSSSHAATVTGSVVTSTANNGPIDPDGSQTIDNSAGNITNNVLETRLDFLGAIQNLGSGFDNFDINPVNIVSFTDASFPDIRFTIGGATATTSGGNVNTANTATSGTAAMRLNGSVAGTPTDPNIFTLTIDFGEFDGTTFDRTKVVDAAGFTISRTRDGQTYSVDFQNRAGASLSLLSLPGNTTDPDGANVPPDPDTGSDLFFGFDAAGDSTFDTGISRIVLTRTSTAGGNTPAGLDDFGFTTAIVPEPATGIMLLGGLGLLVLRRRR